LHLSFGTVPTPRVLSCGEMALSGDALADRTVDWPSLLYEAEAEDPRPYFDYAECRLMAQASPLPFFPTS
jgi:hypothetical protein